MEWIQGKGLYNVRLGRERKGAQVEYQLKQKDVKFIVLYDTEKEHTNEYIVYKVKTQGTREKADMIKLGYPFKAHNKYFCYTLDEEVSIGRYDIHQALSQARVDRKIIEEGEPAFYKCKDFLKYKL